MLNTAYLNGGDVTLKDKGKEYIKFEDPEVLRVLLANGVGDGVGITKTDASKVKSLDNWFKANTTIKTFDEFKYFTSLTSIGSEIFASSSIQRFTLPKECKAIKSALCYSCLSLANVTGLESLEDLSGYSAFIRTALEEINLPNITRIGPLCFRECHKLVKVELGDKISFIDTQAFYSCKNLTHFIVRATIPPSINDDVFYDSSNVSIYVPYGSVEAYKTATGWIEYADRIKPLSEYPGFIIVNGVELWAFNEIKSNDTMSIVGFVDCQPDTDILWGVGNGGQNGILCEYDIDMKYIDYWGALRNPRKIHIKNNTFKIKATFATEYLDYAYIYDETNGVYLWKGKYVE